MQQENTDKLMKPGRGGGPALQKVDPKWFVQLIIKPRATLKAILEKDRPVWLIPLLTLSILAAVEALVFSHLDMTELAHHIRNLDFMQTLPPEEQEFQFLLIGPPVRPLYVYITPFIYAVGRLWIAWYLLSLVMNLILTSSGAKSSLVKNQNLFAWAFLPLGLRYLIQTVSMLFSGTAIEARGLSNLVFIRPEIPQRQFLYFFLNFLQSLLGSVDLFFVWVGLLLVVGILAGFQLPKKSKAIGLGVLAVVLTLVVMALSGALIIPLSLDRQSVFFRATYYFQMAW